MTNSMRCFLLLLAVVGNLNASSSVDEHEDVCYFDMIHGDACKHPLVLSSNSVSTSLPRAKNVACLREGISGLIAKDLGNLPDTSQTAAAATRTQQAKSKRLGGQKEELQQKVRFQQTYQVGDVVVYIALEMDPPPASIVYYPCIVRSAIYVKQEEDLEGDFYYRIERLMDGFQVTETQAHLGPYKPYAQGASNVFCRPKRTDDRPLAVSADFTEQFVECKVLGSQFPNWSDKDKGGAGDDHVKHHSTAENFLHWRYGIMYANDPRTVLPISAHDMFEFDLATEEQIQ